MGDIGIDVHPHDKLDFNQDSKLDSPVESRFDSRIESFGSKLALRASLRYTGEDDQWQTNCGSLRERNKYMFNRELFSDVRFLVGRKEKTSIPAHRYILAISSPVFSSLFYAFGALQTEHTGREQIEISECEPDSFLEMLRFMYYDEVQLTTDNAPKVLFLSKKYLIPSLAEICSEFILKNLNADNTLPVLNHCYQLGVSKGLEKQCWFIIDQHASQIAEENQFVEIDHGTLTAFLARDTLVAKETVLFRAAVQWAGRECQRLSIPLTVENKRSILGDAFYTIRFPLMSMTEFTEDVAQSSFLSHEEVANMYIGYNSNFQSCNIRFPTEPREGTRDNALRASVKEASAESAQDKPFRCPRFESTALRPKCNVVRPQQSTVKFKVKQPISITGVALFTAVTQSTIQSVKVELRDNNDSVLITHHTDPVKRDNDRDTDDILFPIDITLQSDVMYSVTVTSEEVLERYGEGPISEITCEGVDFEFLEEPDNEEQKGRNIPELLFKLLGEETSSASFTEDLGKYKLKTLV